jgi:hypothetical protein
MVSKTTAEGMVALGDQVQETCANSGMDITGFVLLTADGQFLEYRSRYPIEAFRDQLKKVADAL